MQIEPIELLRRRRRAQQIGVENVQLGRNRPSFGARRGRVALIS